MSQPMDHPEISEQLRALALGELPRAQADEVRAHLLDCRSCSAEYHSVELLVGLPLEEPSEIERHRLHANVLGELQQPDPIASPATRGRPGLARARVAQALGAAALLALIGGVGYFVSSLSNGEDTGGLAVGADDTSEAMADIGFELEFRKPQGRTVGGAAPLSKSGDQSGGVAEGDSLTQTENIDEGAPESEVVEDPQPLSADAQDASLRPLYVRGPGILEDRTLNLVGRYGLPLVLFPNVFTPADAMELQTEFLRQLANAAETKKRSQQVLECGSAVLARPDPVLPALATFGRLENKMTLVMAFAWSDGPDGPLERFMVWSWPKGDCNAIPGYRAGFINR